MSSVELASKTPWLIKPGYPTSEDVLKTEDEVMFCGREQHVQDICRYR